MPQERNAGSPKAGCCSTLNEMNATIFWPVLDPELFNSRTEAVSYYQNYFITFDEGYGHRL